MSPYVFFLFPPLEPPHCHSPPFRSLAVKPSGSQMTFCLPWLSVGSSVPDTMAPLLPLLCLLLLCPGRRPRQGFLGLCGQVPGQAHSERTTSFCPSLIWTVFFFLHFPFPQPQAWQLSPALRTSISQVVISPSAMAGPLGASSPTPAPWANTHPQHGDDARATDSGRPRDLALCPPCSPCGW